MEGLIPRPVVNGKGVKHGTALCLAAVVAVGILTAPMVGAAQESASPQGEAGTPTSPFDPLPPDYDPLNDPNHPLKGEADPGPEWNAGNINDWNGDHSGRGTPWIRNAVGSWQWGELFYGRTYPGKLLVRNRCTEPQVVRVYVNHLPYLQGVPERVEVPPETELELDIQIVTPPEPDPPVNPNPFDPTAPGWGWVEPPQLPPQPNPFDPTAPKWHQPNFVDVSDFGEVVLWHPWQGKCAPRRVTYDPAGHIHFNPPDETEDRGPEKIEKPDPCAVYWNTGEPPPDLEGLDCTATMRGLAVAFLENVLRPRAEAAPAAWDWLPTVTAVQEMSVARLLELKARAEALLRDAGNASGGSY